MFVRSLKIATAIVALAATTAAAQKVVATKMGGGGSAHDTVEWTVQGAKITITYGRPNLKGRSLDTLAPAGKVWRTGADAATTLTTDKGLMFGSLMVPAGTYTLYTVPGATTWKLVVSKQTGQWGTQYSEAQDLGRVDANVTIAGTPTELLTLSIIDTPAGASFVMEWENVRAEVPFVIH